MEDSTGFFRNSKPLRHSVLVVSVTRDPFCRMGTPLRLFESCTALQNTIGPYLRKDLIVFVDRNTTDFELEGLLALGAKNSSHRRLLTIIFIPRTYSHSSRSSLHIPKVLKSSALHSGERVQEVTPLQREGCRPSWVLVEHYSP